MMFLNPIIAIIRDEKNNRFHPVLFEESPLPGPPDASKPVRHKSKMHHTGGFAERQAALDHIETELKTQLGCGTVRTEYDFPWDGEGVPALVHFFGDTP